MKTLAAIALVLASFTPAVAATKGNPPVPPIHCNAGDVACCMSNPPGTTNCCVTDGDVCPVKVR